MKKGLKLVVLGALLASMAACSSKPAVFTKGSYTAEADGFGGKVTVTIETDEQKIYGIEIIADDETPEVGQAALQELTGLVIEAQGPDFDGVSGATFTSNAVKEAVADCIEQAKAGK